jgi:hypothetical protein
VPVISTVSGTILARVPPLMVPIVTTAGDAVRSTLRLTMVCRPLTICAEVVIGSIVCQGMPPWPCLPVTLISRLSLLARAAPAR